MIDITRTYAYCSEEPCMIENYAEALADDTQTWVCHHRLELHDDYMNTAKDLQLMNLYYHRPAAELIFVPRSTHVSMHNANKSRKEHIANTFGKSFVGKHHTDETKSKISKALSGKKRGPLTEDHKRAIALARTGKHYPRH